MRTIAAELEVSPSKVSWEVKDHSMINWGQSQYVAEIAHYRALVQQPRRRDGKLDDPDLWDRVVALLNQRFSPRQVATELWILFPEQSEMHVSHETIASMSLPVAIMAKEAVSRRSISGPGGPSADAHHCE